MAAAADERASHVSGPSHTCGCTSRAAGRRQAGSAHRAAALDGTRNCSPPLLSGLCSHKRHAPRGLRVATTWQTPDKLGDVLSRNLKSIDQRLFLRLAEMSDAEEDEYERLRIRQLATLVATTLETVIEQADAQLDADATAVQGLLRTLALESGEFELPVAAPQMEALRTALREQAGSLDEGFVATVKTYMKKASDDGISGMVDVLRVLLQTFAAERLRGFLTGSQVETDEGVQGAMSALLDVRMATLPQPSSPRWPRLWPARVRLWRCVCCAIHMPCGCSASIPIAGRVRARIYPSKARHTRVCQHAMRTHGI